LTAAPEPDPRSRGFAWIDRQGPLRLLSAEQARAFDERGYVLLEGAFDAAVLAPLLEDLDRAEAAVEAFLRTRPDGRLFIARADEITFSAHLVTRSARARAFTRHPLLCDLVHDLVGPDVRLYWDQAVYKKPGTTAPFPWHQDNGYTFIEPQQYLTCWVALTDADLDTGCPWVVPGWHRRGTLAHTLTDLGWQCFDTPPATPVATPVRAGSVVVFSSLTPHATGPNRSADRIRKAYIVQYAPDGAEIVGTDDGRTRCDDPDRQYPILVGGRPVA
jgi:ectoine hydroxylase-related dioxygenase (phytanoyl-CoA dioxygenase family)